MKRRVKRMKKSKGEGSIDKKTLKTGKCIATGSYGVIKKGSVRIDGIKIECAVKEVQLEPDDIEKFKYESEMISECSHENIVKTYGYLVLYDKESIEKTPGFVVMELCEELNLMMMIRRDGIGNKARMYYLTQVVKGMIYLHSREIVHRDLKLANILIGKDGKVKICDFGTSKHDKIANKTLCGTPTHIAPELISLSLRGIEHKLTDVYSFGILIWELWSHKEPYHELKKSGSFNNYALLMKIATNNIRPDLNEMMNPPIGIKKLVCKCWDKSSKQRPQSFEIILKIIIEIDKIVPKDPVKVKRRGKKIF